LRPTSLTSQHRQALHERYQKITSDGELSKSDEIALIKSDQMAGLIKKVFLDLQIHILFFASGANFN
jgi:hypothetical protein